MIPPFEPATGNLPPGVHESEWDEFEARFGYNPHRRFLLVGLKRALDALRSAGCRTAYIDGSFVTAKDSPADFDGCWEPEGVSFGRLDLVLLDFSNQRWRQKAKFGGELFIANDVAEPTGTKFIDYFQLETSTRAPKGIVMLNLGSLP